MAALLATQNGRAWIATSGGALGYLGLCALLGRHQLLPRWLPSRKMIHIGTGPLFMFCWPLYGPGPAARWVAASVPAAAGVVFALVGCRVLHSDALVSVTSRSGRAEELLRGPCFYAVAHVAVTLLLWRHSPAAILALSAVCGGDGLAEVVGRSMGPRTPRLPHNRAKTVAGSLACWAGGTAMALPLLAHLRRCGMFAATAAAAGAGGSGGGAAAAAMLQGWRLAAAVAVCCGVGAAAESLPAGELDNFVVPAATALAARAVLGFW